MRLCVHNTTKDSIIGEQHDETRKPMTRQEILAAIDKERERQDALWGEQNHPATSIMPVIPPPDVFRLQYDVLEAAGLLSWETILSEEFSEAVHATSDDERIEELIQVAAVAVSWIECIERNRT